MISRLISGGQTGADRAGLDVAVELGIPIGGWCPQGRLAEDGEVSSKYVLRETPSVNYAQRTQWNVRDADGTLVFTRGEPSGGTALTLQLAEKLGKPHLVVDLAEDKGPEAVCEWLQAAGIEVLNVAGPRESASPGIYGEVVRFLTRVLQKAGERTCRSTSSGDTTPQGAARQRVGKEERVDHAVDAGSHEVSKRRQRIKIGTLRDDTGAKGGRAG